MQLSNAQRNTMDRDSFLLGTLIGLLFPIIVYGILLALFDTVEQYFLPPEATLSRGFRYRTLPLLAICANLIPFHLYRKWGRDNTMRGMILPTMAFVIYWFIRYGRHMVGLS